MCVCVCVRARVFARVKAPSVLNSIVLYCCIGKEARTLVISHLCTSRIGRQRPKFAPEMAITRGGRASCNLSRVVFAAVVLIVTVGYTNAEPTSHDYVIVERWTADPENVGWQRASSASGNEMVHLLFAVRQRNVDRIDDLLASVADPRSPTYGQFYDMSQIRATFFDEVRTFSRPN